MIEKIIFFNHFNNGDLHVCREFVRKISCKLKKDFSFAHKKDPSLLEDIINLQHESEILNSIPINSGHFIRDNVLYLNTWYASNDGYYISKHGISFECLYYLFDDFVKKYFNFTLNDLSKDPKDFFPKINYNIYYIKNIDNWLKKNNNKRIFISNNHCLSGQSSNFNITPQIEKLASKYNDIDFILTNIEGDYGGNPQILKMNNVFYSKDIIDKMSGSDLNENAYLSLYCDIIIGRASGPFTFTFNYDNLFNRDVDILCFTNLTSSSEKFWIGKEFEKNINYKCNFTTILDSLSENSENLFFETVDKKIKEKWQIL